MIREMFWSASEAVKSVPGLGELADAAADASVGGVRTADFISRLGTYMLETTFRTSFMKTESQKRHYLVDKVHRGSLGAMKSIGFEITPIGYDPSIHKKENFLVVGNHLSYLDPFVMASILPTLFVTSVDMGETAGLGHVCKIAGCIFVERRNRTTIEKDIAQMTDALKDGLNVTIFPEGTSGDGADLLPFKKSLLMSAVFAGKNILPVTLKYTEIDGEPFNRENHDKICWYGDEMPFGPHFLRLMTVRSLKAELHFLPVIPVTAESTRQDLADKSFTAIRNCYLGL